jgi:hypothetical protein
LLPPQHYFLDSDSWEVPSLELPYYFDHRGEISREEESKGKRGDIPAVLEKIHELERKMTKINKHSGEETSTKVAVDINNQTPALLTGLFALSEKVDLLLMRSNLKQN